MRILLVSLLFTLLGATAQSQQLRNPVIPGYHPDPSVCRVGDDYYLVNSSFQYFPGVPIYHSRDLVNWTLIGNVLTRDSQLPLKGATSWQGIYAPTLRYHDGTYYMITTNVSGGGNFLVTAKDPRGPWSEPVWLEQQGIDPSLYFEDGHCYMVSNPDNTIMLCEIDPKTGKQLTASKPLWRGNGGRYPEGPHLYKNGKYYYLLISEGGTELAHGLSIARSKKIDGPYVVNPNYPLLTNCSLAGQTMQIQGTGHGDFVQATDGSWWVVFLAYRNYGGAYHHIGRETCLAPVEWKKNAWPIVNGGQPIDTIMAVRTLALQQSQKRHIRTVFDRYQSPTALGPEWVYLQNPLRHHYGIVGGKLKLTPHGTLAENSQPTFIGRRQESDRIVVETEVTIHHPITSNYGLALYQINDGYMTFYANSRGVYVDYKIKSASSHHAREDWSIADAPEKVRLRIISDGEQYYFEYARSDKDEPFRRLGALECSLISTEVVGGFTGVTIGLFTECTDGEESYGEFSYFDYEER